MIFSIQINFIEKERGLKYQRSTRFNFSCTSKLIEGIKMFLIQLPQNINKIKSRNLFYELDNISFYVDHINVLKVYPKKKTSHINMMTIEQLTYFSNFSLSNSDIAKIIKHHFSFFYFPLEQIEKNRINNLIQDNNPLLLSNKIELQHFSRPKKEVALNIDSWDIKKPNYHTKVVYRGFR